MLIFLAMLDRPEDKRKFEELYNQYCKLMFHVAMRILANQQDAEDAVQMAFEAIAKNVEKLSLSSCPKTKALVVTIVENKSIDILRLQKRHPSVELDESIAGIEIPLPGDNGLADAMAALSPRYREVLLLRFYNGFSGKEISKLLGISQPTAEKLIWRAKEALRKVLAKEVIVT